MVDIRSGKKRPSCVISLRNVPELNGVREDGSTTIGATTLVNELLENPRLGAYPALVEAAQRLGSVQIRNQATVGGNLCNASPCADLAPPLLVYDARVRLETSTENREIPLEAFFNAPGETCLSEGEIVTAVRVDPPSPKARATFMKKGRVAMDLSQVSVAALLVLEGERCVHARVAAGSVAPRPLRLVAVEQLLSGQRVTTELFGKARALAEQEVSPISDLRATAEYRRHMTGVFVERALVKLSA